MNWKIYYTALIAIGLCGCIIKNTSTETITIEVAKNLKNFDTLSLTNIAQEIVYIPLETDERVLVSTITSIDVSENFILIQTNNDVLLFDITGKFINKISGKGNGPLEYNLAGHSVIFNESVLIPNVVGNKEIKVFNFQNEQLTSIPLLYDYLSASYKNWYVLPESELLVQVPNISGKEKFRIIKLNFKGKIINTFPNTTFFDGPSKNLSGGTISQSGQFYLYNNHIRFKEQLNDTLWEIRNNSLVPVYDFSRGKFGMPNYLRGANKKEHAKIWSKMILVEQIFETNKYIFFPTNFLTHYPFDFYRHIISVNGLDMKVKYSLLGVYDKKLKKTFFIKPSNVNVQLEPTGILNDFDGGVNFFPKFFSNNKELINWIEAYKLKEFVNAPEFNSLHAKYPEKKKELEKLANSLDENDNPVLMLVKLKE